MIYAHLTLLKYWHESSQIISATPEHPLRGEVLEVRYPDGSGLLSGWLRGDGAYAGFSCFIDITTTDAPGREVQVVIWPGEPPLVPDVAP